MVRTTPAQVLPTTTRDGRRTIFKPAAAGGARHVVAYPRLGLSVAVGATQTAADLRGAVVVASQSGTRRPSHHDLLRVLRVGLGNCSHKIEIGLGVARNDDCSTQSCPRASIPNERPARASRMLRCLPARRLSAISCEMQASSAQREAILQPQHPRQMLVTP